MTLCHPKNVIIYPKINYPTAVLFKAITPKNKTDDDKLSSVLQKLTLEDPCLEVKRNTETKQLLLGGVGLSHLEAAIYKMKTVYKVEVTLQTPKIVYRESIKKPQQPKAAILSKAAVPAITELSKCVLNRLWKTPLPRKYSAERFRKTISRQSKKDLMKPVKRTLGRFSGHSHQSDSFRRKIPSC